MRTTVGLLCWITMSFSNSPYIMKNMSLGIMTFPTYGKIKMFQTTNQSSFWVMFHKSTWSEKLSWQPDSHSWWFPAGATALTGRWLPVGWWWKKWWSNMVNHQTIKTKPGFSPC
jgi:hypothetical protein